ncbi:MAG: diguanylate cyclase, partial [Eubacteriales bacterium]|nr:diguanylate cyclase [Eubacteriales bacterium]
EQIYEKEQKSSLMIDLLSHIVEFRHGESGIHVQHVRMLTELLLSRLIHKTDRYRLTRQQINLITTASALHDIGKISIDSEILNKPGRLTDEEFTIMKAHSLIGAEMLEAMPMYKDEPLVKTAYEICRWHHERYDGRGYPDGLKGDEIPISAQIVALADVYDALTSERVYKKAFPHEKAIEMITGGQCGTFNPLVLECLTDIAAHIPEEMGKLSAQRNYEQEMTNLTREMLSSEELTVSGRTLQLLEREREKYTFFAAMSHEIQFEYNVSPPMLTLTPWGAKRLGVSELIMNPADDASILRLLGRKVWDSVVSLLRSTTPEEPVIQYDFKLRIDGELRWHRVIARAMWSADEPREYQGAIGKAIDIHDSRMRLEDLERAATHDAMTGLLNRASAKKLIADYLDDEKHHYALVIVDLDYFKTANDTYGHMFGDQVLKHMAEKLRQSVRGTDLAARIGGDEFLIFIRYQDDVQPIIARIFGALVGRYADFTISVSMGVSTTESVGRDYGELFRSADQALYSVKRSGRGQYRFYDESMCQMLSVISPNDKEDEIVENM